MPTIYAIFKSKKGVLQALIDSALPEREFSSLVQESMGDESPENRLRACAKLARSIYDAEGSLIDILRGAPESKELEHEREMRRFERQKEYIQKLSEDKALKKELTLEKARDILWALTGRDIYRMFVLERNWPSDEYENWLAKQLIESLLL
jgi:hypothetical protein